MTASDRRRINRAIHSDLGYWPEVMKTPPKEIRRMKECGTPRKPQTSPLVYLLILTALVYFLMPFVLGFTTPEAVKWGQGHFLTVLSEWDMRVHDKGRIVIVGMDGRRTVLITNSDTNITLEGLFPDENENSAATD